MFERWFGRPSRVVSAPPPQVPPDSRVYSVGDIHGCARLLRALHRAIEADAAQYPTCRKTIVYLGDYIDRGDDSRAVIDILLREPLAGFDCVWLKGNHEASLLTFLEDEQIGPSWLAYGGGATLHSYGVRPPESSDDGAGLLRAQTQLAERIPPEHLDFLRRLLVSHIEGDYFFAHAGLRPNVPFDRQIEEDMLWIRDEFLLSDVDFGKLVVHGHSITAAPEIRRNRIGIDTGAFASGHLTCLVLDGANRSFLTT